MKESVDYVSTFGVLIEVWPEFMKINALASKNYQTEPEKGDRQNKEKSFT